MAENCYTRAGEIDIVYTTAWCTCSEVILSDYGFNKETQLFVFDVSGAGRFKVLRSILGSAVERAGYRGLIVDGVLYVMDSDYNNVVDYLDGVGIDYGGYYGTLPCGGNSTTGEFWIYDFTAGEFKKGTFESTGYRIWEAFKVGTEIYFIMVHKDGQIRRSLVKYSGKEVIVEPNENLFDDVFGADRGDGNIFMPYWKFDGTSCPIARFLVVDSSGNVVSGKEYSSLIGGFYPEYIQMTSGGIAYMYSEGYSECSSGQNDTLWRYDMTNMDFYGGVYFEMDDAGYKILNFFRGNTADWALVENGSDVILVKVDWTESIIESNGIKMIRRSSGTGTSISTLDKRSFTCLLSISNVIGGGTTDAVTIQSNCPS